MKCTECQNEIPAGSVFCPICGSAQFEAPMEAIPEPVAEVTEEPIEAKEAPAEIREEPVAEVEEKPPVKIKKKWWILATACLLAVVILGLFAARRPGYGAYTTADGLFLADLAGGESVLLAEAGSYADVVMTEDQKHIFYVAWRENQAPSLYHLNLRVLSKKPEVLAENVVQFYVNDRGTRLAYVRDGGLYVHNLKSEKLVAEKATRFLCDEAVDTFVYEIAKRDYDVVLESTWYFKDRNGESVPIREDVKSILRLTADGQTLIYSSGNTLFARKNNEEIVIAENARLKGGVYEDGSFYYRTANEAGQEEILFYDGQKSVYITVALEAKTGLGKQPTLTWQDESSRKNYVAVRGKILEIPQGEVKETKISDDGKILSVIMQGKHVGVRDLYTVDVSRGEVQLLEQDAETVFTLFVGKKLYYIASRDGMPHTLYCDGKEILSGARDVLPDYQENGNLLVHGEISPEGHAAIYWVRGDKAVQLTDKGGAAAFASNGDALVTMNATGETAELWSFKRNRKGTMLAKEIMGLRIWNKLRRPSSEVYWIFDY